VGYGLKEKERVCRYHILILRKPHFNIISTRSSSPRVAFVVPPCHFTRRRRCIACRPTVPCRRRAAACRRRRAACRRAAPCRCCAAHHRRHAARCRAAPCRRCAACRLVTRRRLRAARCRHRSAPSYRPLPSLCCPSPC
jgi:hypothetical protein